MSVRPNVRPSIRRHSVQIGYIALGYCVVRVDGKSQSIGFCSSMAPLYIAGCGRLQLEIPLLSTSLGIVFETKKWQSAIVL